MQSSESDELLAAEARVATAVGGFHSEDPQHEQFAEKTARGLRSLNFLQRIGDNELRRAAELMQVELYLPHEILGREGSVAGRVLIVIEGEVIATAQNEWGLPIEIMTHGAGQVLNEILLVDKEHQHSTTTATMKETLIFSFTRVDAAAMKKVAPNVYSIFKSRSEELLTARNTMGQNPMFAEMSPLRKHLLPEIVRPNVYRKLEVIVEKGETKPRHFFMITKGTVEVFVGRKKVRSIGPGQSFGEVSLVTSQPHSATVVVSEDGEVHTLECSRRDFRGLLVGEPAVLGAISLRVLGPNVSLESVLNTSIGRKYLEAFFEKEFAAENIDFLLAVSHFEAIDARIRKSVVEAIGLDPNDVTRRKNSLLLQQADLIYYKYIVPNASSQINLRSTVSDELAQRMHTANYSYDMFADAKREVMDLIASDNFARFRESSEFKQLLKEVGAYNYAKRFDAANEA